jgi:hypothetical protein
VTGLFNFAVKTETLELFPLLETQPSFYNKALLGKGRYARVYETFSEKHVVKFSKKLLDDGWVYYALLCLSNPEKNFSFMPVIEKLVVNFEENTYVAVLEKLEEFSCEEDVPYITGKLNTIPLQLKSSDSLNQQAGLKNQLRCFVIQVLKEDYYKKCIYFDAHCLNWMKRDNNEIVLTDPFSYGVSSEVTREKIISLSKSNPNRVKIVG